MKKLELAWEAVQEILDTEANVQAYLGHLQSFCSYAESTYLIKIEKRKVAAYYDKHEMEAAGEKRLYDFVSHEWLNVFTDKSRKAINESREFKNKYYGKNDDLSKEELFGRVRELTRIHVDNFVVFQACQPQYSARLEPYVLSLLPDEISDDEKAGIVITLSLPLGANYLVEEEIAWGNLVREIKSIVGDSLPELDSYDFSGLERHARKYGLLNTADGHMPWTKPDLYARLKNDLTNRDIVEAESPFKEKQEELQKKQREIVGRFQIPDEAVRLCRIIGEIGNLRLSIRTEGWMPLQYIRRTELFPQLPKHLPYTQIQLEACRYRELLNILDGDYSLTPEELEERERLVFFGILDGQEVLWTGNEAIEKISELVPVVDQAITELKGQSAMRGRVAGFCHVLKWDADDPAGEIESMPDGAILVAGQTRPQLMPAIKKAAAIVTDEGGITSHAAIVSRELGIPCVIGTKLATKVIRTGDKVKVDADGGIVYLLEKRDSLEGAGNGIDRPNKKQPA